MSANGEEYRRVRCLVRNELFAGGNGGGYRAIAGYGWSFMDTPVQPQMTPITQLNYLNTTYVSRVLASLREQVRQAAVYNYALAEGPRAYLQPFTPVDYRGGECDSSALPDVLPGTGCTVFAQDAYETTYALTNPMASARNVETLAKLMGMPIGDYTPPVCDNRTWPK